MYNINERGIVMSVKQVAQRLNVTPQTVKIWIREHKLKATITPRGYKVSENQLQDYLNNHKK
jgi:excisionase family DNA binding protein